ncbi:MAG: hypothetical protein M3320_10660, partial [Actinomycetota bacterium]|nr:hypothetical protein [Actinomycetota bacterium]
MARPDHDANFFARDAPPCDARPRMAETDPFGRGKDEDPLAEMGWSSSETAAPSIGPADIARPEQADRAARRAATRERTAPPPSGFRRPRQMPVPTGIPGQSTKNRAGCILTFVVLIFIGAIALAVVPAIIDAIDTVEK